MQEFLPHVFMRGGSMSPNWAQDAQIFEGDYGEQVLMMIFGRTTPNRRVLPYERVKLLKFNDLVVA